MQESVKSQWSTRQLERQINSFFYERLLSSKNKEKIAAEIPVSGSYKKVLYKWLTKIVGRAIIYSNTDDISQSRSATMQKETDKHNQIITAAAALFARQGYRKTTIDEIVVGAGISKGLFYHYFNNKKELYIYLYNSYADILSQSIREKVDTSETDLFVRLKQISHTRIDFVINYPNLFNFLYSAYYETHPDVAPLIKGKNEKLLQESYTSSAYNINWSRLRKGLSTDKAIEIITWVAEGFVRKIVAQETVMNKEAYLQFDEYIEYLKSGLYVNEEGEA